MCGMLCVRTLCSLGIACGVRVCGVLCVGALCGVRVCGVLCVCVVCGGTVTGVRVYGHTLVT